MIPERLACIDQETTGAASKPAWSAHIAFSAAHFLGDNLAAMAASHFFTRTGIASARRRRWPMGASTLTFSVLLPSLKKTCTLLPM